MYICLRIFGLRMLGEGSVFIYKSYHRKLNREATYYIYLIWTLSIILGILYHFASYQDEGMALISLIRFSSREKKKRLFM